MNLVYLPSLFRNLLSIEKFTKKKLKRSGLRKIMSHSKDMADIVRYREMLRQSLDIYGVSVSLTGPTLFFKHALDTKQHLDTETSTAAHGPAAAAASGDGGRETTTPRRG